MTRPAWPPLRGLRRARREAAAPRRAVPVLLDSELPGHLTRLHAAYVEQVNQAVAEGRDDLVRALVDAYTDEALAAMTQARPT